MNKKKELIKNTLILALGKVSTQLISFLLLPLYTLFLSPGEYGTVDLIITYVALLVPAITVQLEMASFRFLIDVRKNEAGKKLVISNILQIVGVILLTCIALFWLVNMFLNLQYAGLILLNIVVTIFSSLFLQFARGVGDNKKFAIASILAGVTTLVGTLIFIVSMHMGAAGMLLSIALANIMCAIYLFASLKLYKYISFANRDIDLQKKLIGYSFPLVPNGVSWWVISVSDRTIISIVIGVAANGIYAVANKYATILSSVFLVFGMAWTESASVHINDKNRDKFFSDTVNASIRLFGSFGLVLIAYIPLMFSFLIGAQYSEAYLYIPILIIGAFFNSIVSLYGTIYIAKKMTKQVANTSIIAAVINIVLTLVFIKFIGLYAAAIATAIAYLAMSIYRHYDVKKYVKITYEKNMLVKLTILYALAILLYYYNNVIGNIASTTIITVVALLLNRSIIRVIKDKVLSYGKRKKLTTKQEEYENLL